MYIYHLKYNIYHTSKTATYVAGHDQLNIEFIILHFKFIKIWKTVSKLAILKLFDRIRSADLQRV